MQLSSMILLLLFATTARRVVSADVALNFKAGCFIVGNGAAAELRCVGDPNDPWSGTTSTFGLQTIGGLLAQSPSSYYIFDDIDHAPSVDLGGEVPLGVVMDETTTCVSLASGGVTCFGNNNYYSGPPYNLLGIRDLAVTSVNVANLLSNGKVTKVKGLGDTLVDQVLTWNADAISRSTIYAKVGDVFVKWECEDFSCSTTPYAGDPNYGFNYGSMSSLGNFTYVEGSVMYGASTTPPTLFAGECTVAHFHAVADNNTWLDLISDIAAQNPINSWKWSAALDRTAQYMFGRTIQNGLFCSISGLEDGLAWTYPVTTSATFIDLGVGVKKYWHPCSRCEVSAMMKASGITTNDEDTIVLTVSGQIVSFMLQTGTIYDAFHSRTSYVIDLSAAAFTNVIDAEFVENAYVILLSDATLKGYMWGASTDFIGNPTFSIRAIDVTLSKNASRVFIAPYGYTVCALLEDGKTSCHSFFDKSQENLGTGVVLGCGIVGVLILTVCAASILARSKMVRGCRIRRYLRMRGKSHVVFISHHKKDAAEVANTMHRFLNSELRAPSFLDVDDLRNLADLREEVKKSCVLVALQTQDYLARPWCLVELYEAMRSEIPIVPVYIEGKGYDFAVSVSAKRSPHALPAPMAAEETLTIPDALID